MTVVGEIKTNEKLKNDAFSSTLNIKKYHIRNGRDCAEFAGNRVDFPNITYSPESKVFVTKRRLAPTLDLLDSLT